MLKRRLFSCFLFSVFVFSLVGCDLANPKNPTKRDTPDVGPSTKVAQKPVQTVVQDDSETFDPNAFHLTATYTDPKYGYRFNYNPAWVKMEQGSDIFFMVKNNRGDGQGGVTVHVDSKKPNLLKSSRRDIEKDIKKNLINPTLHDFKLSKFKGIDCLYYSASTDTSQGIRGRSLIYEFNHKNNYYCVTFFAVEEKFEEYLPVYDAVSKSFKLP